MTTLNDKLTGLRSVVLCLSTPKFGLIPRVVHRNRFVVVLRVD